MANPVKTKIIDLSHTIDEGTISYKGLPAPIICDYLSREASKKVYANGYEFHIGKIEMVGNTGTYIDCPFHRFGDGDDFTSINIDKFVNLEAIKIVAPHSNGLGVGLDLLADLDVTGKAVLIHTGWDEHWMQDQYYHDHPYLTVEAANFLKDKGAVLVGIDSHNIDDTRTNARPVHTILLGAGILIVEHLCNLSPLPTSDFLFSAAPPKIKGMGTFPVRAYGVVRH